MLFTFDLKDFWRADSPQELLGGLRDRLRPGNADNVTLYVAVHPHGGMWVASIDPKQPDLTEFIDAHADEWFLRANAAIDKLNKTLDALRGGQGQPFIHLRDR